MGVMSDDVAEGGWGPIDRQGSGEILQDDHGTLPIILARQRGRMKAGSFGSSGILCIDIFNHGVVGGIYH